MTDKAVISEYTYRTLKEQRDALGDMPVFVLPDDLSQLFRKTTRKTDDCLHVQSLGVLAETEVSFREFLSLAKKSKVKIASNEDEQIFVVNGNCEHLVKWWKDARRNGAAKIGARMSADRKKAVSAEGVAKIKDRWPLPTKEHPTMALLEEAGLSLNTVKSLLGPRPIAQYNHRVKNGRQIKQFEINPEPREKMDFCGVYVFQVQRGVYKIGSSNDATRRFKQVSQHHLKDMKVVEIFNMDRSTAYAVELEAHRLLHKCLANEYRGKEIFRASLETIKKTIRRAIKTVSRIPTMSKEPQTTNWQPIETAPKDGTLHLRGYFMWSLNHKNPVAFETKCGREKDGEFYYWDGEESCDNFVLWAPIPEAPL